MTMSRSSILVLNGIETTWVMSEAVWVEEIWSAVASCITPAELTSVNRRKINKELLTELIMLLTHLGYDRQMV